MARGPVLRRKKTGTLVHQYRTETLWGTDSLRVFVRRLAQVAEVAERDQAFVLRNKKKGESA